MRARILPVLKPRQHRWAVRAAVALVAYLVLWAVTAAAGPAAVERAIADTYRDSEVHTGCAFFGEGFGYGPEPRPTAPHWCCVGWPSVPMPFVVRAEFAFRMGPLAAGGGKAFFVWTPWAVYPVGQRWAWVT